jgi:hypothetical protein
MPQQPTASSNPTPQQPPAQNPGVQPPAQNPGGQPPAQNPGMMQPPAQNPGTMQPPAAGGKPQLAMDECGLMTKYPGDEFCIKAPPPDKGFQMHIGPEDINSPEAKYLLQPGGEVTENFPETAGNDKMVYYYWRQYRMRPGSHHLIITEGAGRRLGGSSNSAKDNPEAGVIAPENKGVGMPLGPKAALNNSLHYFNFTDKPVVKEVWVNFWYRDPAEVTEPAKEVFQMLGMGIGPGEHVNVHGSCAVRQPGRLLTAYGHVHAHNKRFSVWHTAKGGQKQLIHDAYDWEHPYVSEYSSTVMNPALVAGMKKDGGHSGVVELAVGDTVDFECEIVNDTNSTFIGLNEANDDEMCILIGDTVGTQFGLRDCQQTETPVTGGSAR